MIKNIKTNTKEETLELGKKLSNFLFKGSVVLLCGHLGAGKTTLTKGIGKGLGVEEEINSPTFNILKCYFNKTLNLYHIDAYRLEDVPEENKNIGLEEVIDGDGCAIIEWPQFISEFIDYKKALIITITIDENNVRNFKFETENLKFEGLFAGLL